MTKNSDERLLDTNICIAYMNACAMNNLDFLQSISIKRENWTKVKVTD